MSIFQFRSLYVSKMLLIVASVAGLDKSFPRCFDEFKAFEFLAGIYHCVGRCVWNFENFLNCAFQNSVEMSTRKAVGNFDNKACWNGKIIVGHMKLLIMLNYCRRQVLFLRKYFRSEFYSAISDFGIKSNYLFVHFNLLLWNSDIAVISTGGESHLY